MFRFNPCGPCGLLALAAAPLFAQTLAAQTEDAAAAPDAGEATGDVIDVCRRWDDESESWRFGTFTDDDGCELVVVTGTRLGDDPTLRVDVLTAEEIAARGLTTAEEILRAIPQNVATINAYNNTSRLTSLDVRMGELGIGVATRESARPRLAQHAGAGERPPHRGGGGRRRVLRQCQQHSGCGHRTGGGHA